MLVVAKLAINLEKQGLSPSFYGKNAINRVAGGALPHHLFAEQNGVGGIVGGESVAAVLHAEHDKRLRAVVAHRPFAAGRHTHHAPFAYGKHVAVDLELAYSPWPPRKK